MIGERLKQLRKAKKLRQRELAEILGVRKAMISLYETGKNDPHDPIKVKIAKYFDVSLDYLLGVIDDEVKPYSEHNFVKLPEDATEEEKQFIQKLTGYITFFRNQS